MGSAQSSYASSSRGHLLALRIAVFSGLLQLEARQVHSHGCSVHSTGLADLHSVAALVVGQSDICSSFLHRLWQICSQDANVSEGRVPVVHSSMCMIVQVTFVPAASQPLVCQACQSVVWLGC